MIKIKRGTLTSVVVLTACTWQIPAQFSSNTALTEPPLPVAINLDIAPTEPPDPEAAREHDVAIQALERPDEFHALLLSLDPQRGPLEQLARLAILFPDVFVRAHPKNYGQLRAEAAAAHAILNPHFVVP